MNWTEAQIEELRTLCFEEMPNAQLAEHFGVHVTEIHAKRSRLGITIPMIKAAKGRPTIAVNPVLGKGLETFGNGENACIVLARSGESTLICMPESSVSPFVVPLQHIPGAKSWWQGRYFKDLASAWKYYQTAIGADVR